MKSTNTTTGHQTTKSTQTTTKHLQKFDIKTFNKPEETRTFPHGRVEIVNVGGMTIGRATFEAGWKWSSHMQPIAKTHSCDAAHLGYQISGVMRIKMDDGTEFDCHPGDVCLISPGHDAWVVGKETVVIVDFQGMSDYAKSPSHSKH